VEAANRAAAIFVVAGLEDQRQANLLGDRLDALGQHHGVIARFDCAGATYIDQRVAAANFDRGYVAVAYGYFSCLVHNVSLGQGFIRSLDIAAFLA